MTLFASAVMSQNDHGYEAGRYVATHILAAFERTRSSLLVACITTHYREPAEVVQGIRSIVDTIPLVGLCSPGVITSAGIITRGVAVLALRSDAMRIELALENSGTGVSNATLERMINTSEDGLVADTSRTDYTTMLVLSSGQATSIQPVDTQATYGTCVQAATTGGVFVNDQFAPSGVALARMRSAAPMTITTPDAMSSAPDTTHAALLFDCALFVDAATDSQADDAVTPPTLDTLRANIGYATPLLGATGLQAVGMRDKPDARTVGVVM